MLHNRSFPPWFLALACAMAFVVGASAQDPVVRVSQGVVTPDDPIFPAQDPAPDPDEPETPDPDEPDEPDDPDEGGQAEAVAPGPGRGTGGRGGRGRGAAPRTYEQFMREATTDEGVFDVHRIDDSVYFEIPAEELGKDYLWVSQIKRTSLGAGFGGQAVADRVVRWERNQDRVYLKMVRFDLVADPESPIARAVEDANTPTIVRGFNVVVSSPDDDPVIDVTSLLLGDVAEFSPRQQLGARGMDQSRSYLEKVVAFPGNINAQIMQTYAAGTGGGGAAGGGRGRGGGIRGSSGTVVVFHSMVKLPETPMMPRLADARVGYFWTSMYDYGRDENRAVERTYITRYRLEKQDPSAERSDPIKPIVYYVDPATPAKLVPWVKRGIEAWLPAFEEAGFTNAIVAREAPSPDEDPDWDPEDVRYSVIRWLPSRTENASGPHVHDPRSGEILEADIQLHHNVQRLAEMWYFTQAGALDPRAQKLPLPDDLVGRLIQFIVSHEVGHALGFQHNMKASSLYTVDQVRDSDWVHENGHTPTLMDYSRINYVAQPEDGIAVEDLIPKIGPYDRWATMWGYKPIPGADSPDAERPTLDAWAREQEATPYLRFTTSNSLGSDPGEQEEAVGDADPTRATELGLKNLERVAALLVPAATSRPGEPYDELRDVYGRVVTQWRTELGHVVNVVGGVASRERYVGQDGPRFTAIAADRQRQAVSFLLDHAFEIPAFLVDTDLLRRIEPTGVVSRLRTAQNSLMNELLQASRLDRLVEQAALAPGAYSPLAFLTDLRTGIWRELSATGQPIDLYRRNVQRAYLDTIDARLHGSRPPTDEVRALLRGELRAVDQQVETVLPSMTDLVTRRHLQDVRETIEAMLDPRVVRAEASGGGRGGDSSANEPASDTVLWADQPYDYDHDPFLQPRTDCWVDLVIR